MSIMMVSQAVSVYRPKATSLESTRRRKSTYPTARIQTRIHRLIKDEGIVLVPGCYDALSAAIVQKTGFSAGFVSGYSVSASLLGQPDLGLLTLPEIAQVARFVCAAAPLIPIMVDAGKFIAL